MSSSSSTVEFFLEHEKAVEPKRSSDMAAGYDLVSVEDILIPAKGRALVSTGLGMRIPAGFYGRIGARSGLALKHGLDVGAGVIDRDYTGILYVLLFNHDETKDYQVKCGDRIAQLIFECNMHPTFVKVDRSELYKTIRGEQGFGSTGV